MKKIPHSFKSHLANECYMPVFQRLRSLIRRQVFIVQCDNCNERMMPSAAGKHRKREPKPVKEVKQGQGNVLVTPQLPLAEAVRKLARLKLGRWTIPGKKGTLSRLR